MGKILELLKTKKVLLSDGAWGTEMYKLGLKPGECPDLWAVEKPDQLYKIAKSYIDAGSDMVQACSFGANRIKLDSFGLGDRVREINMAAAGISRKAAEDRIVAASMSSTGKMLLMGDITEEEMYEVFAEQGKALEEGGADAVCIETMTDADEARIAITAVRENTGLEILSTYTYEKRKTGDFRTMMGLDPVSGTQKSVDAGADIVGTNCGNGIVPMIDIVREIRQAFPDSKILVHANAGLPENVDGIDVYSDTPEFMAEKLPELICAGADIVGGCCGTTPEHIRLMRKVIDSITG